MMNYLALIDKSQSMGEMGVVPNAFPATSYTPPPIACAACTISDTAASIGTGPVLITR
jgi:hypothetical protein